MSQDFDPLLEYSVEVAAAPPAHKEPGGHLEPPKAAESIKKPAQSVVVALDAPVPAATSEEDDAHRDLAQRVARLERLLDRSLLENTALKSDVATLVTTLDDIRKRLSRAETSPGHAMPAPVRGSRGRPIAAGAVLVAALGLAWSVISIATGDAPELPPVEWKPGEPATSPTPVVDASPPQVELQQPPSATPVLAPAGPPQAREAKAPRDPPVRPAPRTFAGYVGTLAIDADPAGEVFLNRKSVGRTPLRLEGLRAGSHLIWIERDGYRRWTRVVAVGADRISRVSATLDPLSR